MDRANKELNFSKEIDRDIVSKELNFSKETGRANKELNSSKEIGRAIINKELQRRLKAFTRSQEAGRRHLESASVQSN